MADNNKKALALRGKDTNAAPTKKTMNFVRHESAVNLKKLIPIVLVILVVLGIFAKFGILDQLNKKTMALNELGDKQMQLEAANMKLQQLAELEEQYNRYSFGLMDEKERAMVDRNDVLTLFENQVKNVAIVKNFAVNDNVLTTNISGITLDQASRIVQNLEQNPLVESATVYSATAQDGEQAEVSMSVILKQEQEEEAK